MQSNNSPIQMLTEEMSRVLPRQSFGNWPTPVQKLEELSKDMPAEIWVKRDDLSCEEYGGNRVRQMEWLLSDVKRKGAKRIISIGGIGSNYMVALTVYAKKMGLESDIIVVDQPLTPNVRQNLLLGHHFGANIHYAKTFPGAALKVTSVLIKNWAKDKVMPYLIRPGAATGIGSFGYAFGTLELAEQIKQGVFPKPDCLFVATTSCGTIAGLLAGLSLAGLELKVIGVQAAESYITNHGNIHSTYNQVMKLVAKNAPEFYRASPKTLPKFELCKDFFGGKYGQPIMAGEEAVAIARQKAGLTLEGTYTGKAFAAVLDWSKKPENRSRRALFWNTYNSRDFSQVIVNKDWHQLPKVLWKYFDGSIALVNAKK